MDCSQCKFARVEYDYDTNDFEGEVFCQCENEESEFHGEYVHDVCELFEETSK